MDVSHETVVWLDRFVDFRKYTTYASGNANVMITPRNGFKMYIYDKLKYHENGNHYKVYLKEDIPEKYHIKHNKRTPPIILICEPGWTSITNRNGIEWFRKDNKYWLIGTHGYSPFERDMNPAFYAYGPAFRTGYNKTCIETVDIYSLMCHILDISPRQNDGDFDRVKDLLKEFKDSQKLPKTRSLTKCF